MLSPVADAMAAYRCAAAHRGAYIEQCDRAEAAIELLEAAPAEVPSEALLRELQGSLQRLITNVSSCCKKRRLGAQSPQRVVARRLSTARSRVVRQLQTLPAAPDKCRRPDSTGASPASSVAPCALLAAVGPRHLCECRCYYREYEPSRRLHALRLKLAEHGVPSEAAAGWRAEGRVRPPPAKRVRRSEGGREAGSAGEWSVVFVSAVGAEHASTAAAFRALAHNPAGAGSALVVAESAAPRAPAGSTRGAASPGAGSALVWSPLGQSSRYFAASAPPPAAQPVALAPEAAERLPRAPLAEAPWRPPRSPFGLLEELLWDRPWALLLCCILLNQTTRVQVDPVLCRLLRRAPDAAALAVADASELEAILRPLGLHRRRAQTLLSFSRAFLAGSWRRVEELPGVGKYAADAHAIFCLGRWREVTPDDHALNAYHEWLSSLA